MPQISIYEATRIPRYRLVDDESALVSNLVGQRAFLATALSSMCEPFRGSFELRFRADLEGAVRVFVAIETPDDADSERRRSGIRVTERLLPRGYAWNRADVAALNGELQGRPVRIAKLVRAMEFVDLPPANLAAVGNLVADAAPSGAAPAAVSGQRTPRPAPGGRSATDLSGRERELPPLFTSGRTLSQLRLCLPLLGPLSPWRAEARVLMEELIASKPAVISIHLRPTFAGELDLSLPAAALWRLSLRDYLHEIAGSGVADPGTIIRGFARYALPAGQLFQISMRCGALHDSNAMAIASVLAASLGGVRSFSVVPPASDKLVGSLRNIWADYPRCPLDEDATDDWRDLALRGVRAANVADPEDREAVDLLARAPHLYTIDEAEIIAQLPISGEDGLPGLDTEMVPPFHGGPARTKYAAPAPGPGSGDAPETSSQDSGRRLRIGQLVDRHGLRGEGTIAWHHIPLDDLSKHALVVGSTGSGKTVATSFLLTELARLGTEFLVIEPVKTEYYDRLGRQGLKPTVLRRFRFEGDDQGKPATDFPPFDPLYLQSHVTVSRHASYLKSCFEAAFPLDAASALILENGIRKYYTDRTDDGCCLGMFSRGGPSSVRIGRRAVQQFVEETDDKGKKIKRVTYQAKPCLHPSLDGFMSFFLYKFLPQAVRIQSSAGARSSELLETWTQMFERRFDAIQSGMLGIAAGKAFELYRQSPSDYDPFANLIRGNVIFELDGIPDDEQKALMMAFMFTFLFEKRQAEDFQLREAGKTPLEQLRHVVVIEEAHRLLANGSAGGRGDLAGLGAKAKSVSAFVDMLAEVRAFGQGLVVVEQIPTKIVPEAVKNTNLKIMLRLTAADDREFLGAAMNLTDEQKRFVTSLRADEDGVNMVVFEQQLDQPRLLKLPFGAGQVHGPDAPMETIH
jgi:hypothetical protein